MTTYDYLQPHIPQDWSRHPWHGRLVVHNPFYSYSRGLTPWVYINCLPDYTEIWSLGKQIAVIYLADPDFLEKVLKAAGIK